MPRPTKSSPAEAAPHGDPERIERLIDAVETVSAQIELLRIVLDELREEFAWAVRNDRFRSPPHIVHVTSMAADPCASDWAERLNRVSPAELAAMREEQSVPVPPPEVPQQGEFWS